MLSRVEILVSDGKVEEAYRLLVSAEERGNAEATFILAQWRMAGTAIARDLAEARRLYGRAFAGGIAAARDCYLALLANGAGKSGRRWDEALRLIRQLAPSDEHLREQVELIAAMNLDTNGNPRSFPKMQDVHGNPRIAVLRNFLSASECDYLMRLAEPGLQPSVIVHPNSGQLVRDPIRTSTAAAFPFVAETPALHAINRRISAVTETSYEQGEPTQVLSYVEGQEYKPHSDALSGEHNQRTHTFLVYLNEDYEGGETAFINLRTAFRGRRGDAILFQNVDAGGKAEPLAVHAGLPVRRGRKFLLSKWIRENPLDLTGPTGRAQ